MTIARHVERTLKTRQGRKLMRRDLRDRMQEVDAMQPKGGRRP